MDNWLWWFQLRRWIRPTPRSFLLVLFGAALSYQVVNFFLQNNLEPLADKSPDPFIPSKSKLNNRTNDGEMKMACQIPQLDPYDKSIEHLVRRGQPPASMQCEDRYKRLFKSTFDSRIIPLRGEDHIRMEGWVSCCYRTVERDMKYPKPDGKEKLSSECFPVSFAQATNIPEEHEFIAIFCTNDDGDEVPLDLHAFVPLKPTKKVKGQMAKKDKLNVLILGLDAISRMNFRRIMPQTRAFLMKDMGAVEMTGYNRMGAGTFENLIPLLISKNVDSLPCLNTFLNDDCPMLWNQFSDSGYSTCLSDDHFDFNFFSRGFRSQPTDHYPHPLLRWGNSHIGSYEMRGGIGHGCLGPRMSFQFHLNYMEKHVRRMSEAKNSFFHFSWVTMLAHGDDLATGALGEGHLLKSLKKLKKSQYLDNTLLILMSDRGLHLPQFGNTPQGQLEERLPFLFFVFPDSFKEKYAPAYQNLLGNKDKLMTVLDVHETLLDILDLERIQGAHHPSGNSKLFPHGQSLFLPIPPSRTCESAGIGLEHCSCNFLKKITLEDRPALLSASMAAVTHINSLLKDHILECSRLKLLKVVLAYEVGWEADDHSETFSIHFLTEPGEGAFKTIVHRKGNELSWTVQGNITRMNGHGRQSRCIEDPKLKPFCYCGEW